MNADVVGFKQSPKWLNVMDTANIQDRPRIQLKYVFKPAVLPNSICSAHFWIDLARIANEGEGGLITLAG